ncbi:hypothetical protein [Thermaurantiacus sp.]
MHGLRSAVSGDRVDVLSLEGVARDIVVRWYLLPLGAVLGFAAGLIHLSIAEPKYTATVTLAPVLQEGSSGSRLEGLGRLGSLGSLAGLGGAFGRSGMEFRKFFEVAKSRTLADRLVANKPLATRLFHQEWDQSAARWRPPDGFVPAVKGWLANSFGIDALAWQPPDGSRMQQLLRRRLAIVEDPDSPFIRLNFEGRDRDLSLQLLLTIVDQTDSLLRHAALDRSSKRIAFIEAQIPFQPSSDLQKAFATELAEQQRTRIFAASAAPFAAEPLTPATVSSRPTWPIPLISLGVGTGLGLMLAAIAAAWLGARRRRVPEPLAANS